MDAYVKYPRTYHLPWSLGSTNDDKFLANIEAFYGRDVVVTEKMDGENTTMLRNHIHARSVDSSNHISREWVKRFWSTFSYEIPEGFRICGENMFARHSVSYTQLQSYFLGFSVWDGTTCLSWAETIDWFELLGVTPVKVLYRGKFDEDVIRGIELDSESQEGYVVRLADSFDISDFNLVVGKFVRENHVQTDQHWMHSEVVPNKLKESA